MVAPAIDTRIKQRQYSQIPAARNRTTSRSAESISGIARGQYEFQLRGCLCHPDKVFEVIHIFPSPLPREASSRQRGFSRSVSETRADKREEECRFRISSGVGRAASSSRTSAAPSKPDWLPALSSRRPNSRILGSCCRCARICHARSSGRLRVIDAICREYNNFAPRTWLPSIQPPGPPLRVLRLRNQRGVLSWSQISL